MAKEALQEQTETGQSGGWGDWAGCGRSACSQSCSCRKGQAECELGIELSL